MICTRIGRSIYTFWQTIGVTENINDVQCDTIDKENKQEDLANTGLPAEVSTRYLRGLKGLLSERAVAATGEFPASSKALSASF